jgi:hypothetical protein
MEVDFASFAFLQTQPLPRELDRRHWDVGALCRIELRIAAG